MCRCVSVCERGCFYVYLCERKESKAEDRERGREKKERMQLVVCFCVTSYVCAAFCVCVQILVYVCV